MLVEITIRNGKIVRFRRKDPEPETVSYTAVVNLGHNPDIEHVYIGRPSIWGNPFVVNKDGNRAECIEKFREHFLAQPELVEKAKRELRGRVLGCYCKPRPCHGDVIAEIIDGRKWKVPEPKEPEPEPIPVGPQETQVYNPRTREWERLDGTPVDTPQKVKKACRDPKTGLWTAIPFGPHVGVPLGAVPTEFLAWYLANVEDRGNGLYQAVEFEFGKRDDREDNAG